METTDKLAEEILDNLMIPEIPSGAIVYMRHEVIKAMQEYAEKWHEAKLKEITDDDIEAWAKPIADHASDNPNKKLKVKLLLKVGAKAILNGEIKHIDNGH